MAKTDKNSTHLIIDGKEIDLDAGDSWKLTTDGDWHDVTSRDDETQAVVKGTSTVSITIDSKSLERTQAAIDTIKKFGMAASLASKSMTEFGMTIRQAGKSMSADRGFQSKIDYSRLSSYDVAIKTAAPTKSIFDVITNYDPAYGEGAALTEYLFAYNEWINNVGMTVEAAVAHLDELYILGLGPPWREGFRERSHNWLLSLEEGQDDDS